MTPPRTPDGRYLVIDGRAGPRLWRASDPALADADRQRLVDALMRARRAVRAARGDPDRLTEARAAVDCAKRGLGERGPPWWSDGAPDFNRRLIRNTPYHPWWEERQSFAQPGDAGSIDARNSAALDR